jgi:predicted secreted protein
MAFSTVAVSAVIADGENTGTVPLSPNDGKRQRSIVETTHMDVLVCNMVADLWQQR